MLKNVNRVFDISIDEPHIVDTHGNEALVDTTNTTFLVKKTGTGVLVANTDMTPPASNDISAIIIDRLNNLL